MSYKLLALSDLHLSELQSDERYPLFLEILEKFKKSSYDELLFMGDIFDIMIGPKLFWKKIHSDFFQKIEEIIQSGKKVTWVQGNHDFQLAKLLKPMGINWVEESEVIIRENLKIYLSHGDLADWTDKLHPLLRAFLTSRLLGFIIKLIPEDFGEKVLYPKTVKLSQASRKFSVQRERVEKAKTVFRNYAERLAQKNPNSIIILGHSHISDDYELSSSSRYLNFGSWHQEKPLGVIHIEGSSCDVKVYQASTWLRS